MCFDLHIFKQNNVMLSKNGFVVAIYPIEKTN